MRSRLWMVILAVTLFPAATDSLFGQIDTTRMRTYYMVFLFKGPNRSQDSVESDHLQKAHMENIARLAREGSLVVAGPFMDDGDLRGIFIFAVGSMDETERLVETDPAVRAGRLRYEIHPWLSQRGSRLP